MSSIVASSRISSQQRPRSETQRRPRGFRYILPVLLPAMMAIWLAMVPIIGRFAAIPLVCVFVPIVIWCCFADTEAAIYTYIAWCWMDGTIRGVLGDSQIFALGREIVLALMLVTWLIRRKQNAWVNPIMRAPCAVLISLYIFNFFLQVFNPHAISAARTVLALFEYIAPIPLYFMAFDTIRTPVQVKRLCLFLVLATFVVSCVSVDQYLHGKNWTFAHFPGTSAITSVDLHAEHGASIDNADVGLFKPPGCTTYGGATGLYAGFAVPIAFTFLMLARKRALPLLWRLGMLPLIAFEMFTILVNGLRNAIVHAIVGVVLFAVLCKGATKIKAISYIALLALFGIGIWGYGSVISGGGTQSRYSSLLTNPLSALHQDRQSFFEQFGEMAVSSPLGIGLGRNGAVAGYMGGSAQQIGLNTFTESYLGYLVFEAGIPAAILILLIALSFLKSGFQVIRSVKEPDDSTLAAGLVTVLVIIFADLFFMPILTQPPGSVIFWLFGAILQRAFINQEQVETHEDVPSRPQVLA